MLSTVSMRRYWGVIMLSVLVGIYGCGSSTSGPSIDSKAQTSGGAEDSNVVASVSAMTKGDLYYVTFDSNGDAAIDFTGASAGTEYTLMVQSTNQISSSVSIAQSDISMNLADTFDLVLRQKENIHAEDGDLPVARDDTSFSVGKSVGDTRSFISLTNISGTTYETVNAVEKCRDDHIIVYLDSRVPSSDMSDTDIASLCGNFEYAAATEETIIGGPSDVDGDGHVAILITLSVNKMGASGGGIITGYFYSDDLYAYNAGSNPTSNEMEIIYVLAPDPDNEYGAVAISNDFATEQLLTAVVPHELQHAISYNQHVLINGGSSENSWLNEGMSHLMEDVVGFGQENPSRIEGFLNSPGSTSLSPSSSPGLNSRGAEYLFLEYLYEQADDPNGFLAALVDTSNTGKTNIETSFAGADANFDEWSEFMRRWGVALALTDTGISSTAQYQYDPRTWNSTTSHWQGVCVICAAEDGAIRNTTLTGPYMQSLTGSSISLSLSGTATAFYSIASPPTTVTLSGSSSAGLQGVLIRTE